MSGYSFLSVWLIAAPRDRVFEALWQSESWPEWWPGLVEATELDPGDPATGLGRRGRYEWRSRIPYPVRFEVVSTRIERPVALEGRATGDLEGTGRWRLFEERGATAILYAWDVQARKRWLRAAGPLLGPLLRWNHDHLMAAGGRGLARRLDAPLLAAGR